MEREINTETVLNSDWLKARKERAKKLKRRRELYKINRDKILARNKVYRATHKDTRDRSEYRRKYYLANRDRLLLLADEYRLKPGYKEKHKAYMKKYHKEHGW